MYMPGSVFIMDVNQSSSIEDPSIVTKYLSNMVEWIHELSKSNPKRISYLHRFGDEILLVARGFEVAYLFAYYIRATWALHNHPPYFGIGYGDLATEFPGIHDLETWNSPVVKHARRSIDTLKSIKRTHRPYLMFDEEQTDYRHHNSVLNEYARIQDRFFKLQTNPESLASAMYSINAHQEWIASTLDKNRSTISRQIHKSNIDLILTIKNRVAILLSEEENVLNLAANHAHEGETREALDHEIKKQLMSRVNTIRDSMIELEPK